VTNFTVIRRLRSALSITCRIRWTFPPARLASCSRVYSNGSRRAIVTTPLPRSDLEQQPELAVLDVRRLPMAQQQPGVAPLRRARLGDPVEATSAAGLVEVVVEQEAAPGLHARATDAGEHGARFHEVAGVAVGRVERVQRVDVQQARLEHL